jgi:hypothetical protein
MKHLRGLAALLEAIASSSPQQNTPATRIKSLRIHQVPQVHRTAYLQLTFSEEDKRNQQAIQTGDATWEVLETIMRHLIWWHFESRNTESYLRVIGLVEQLLQDRGITVVWDPFGQIRTLDGGSVEKSPVDLGGLRKTPTTAITTDPSECVALRVKPGPAGHDSGTGRILVRPE